MSEATDSEDLEILFPERQMTIAGESITVKEFGFAESLRLDPFVADFVTGIRDRLDSHKAAEPTSYMNDVVVVFGEHPDAALELVAAACGKPIHWAAGLSAKDGQMALMAMWVVNANFFMQRLQVVKNHPVVESHPESSFPP